VLGSVVVTADLTQLIAMYGVWLVAAFILLESIGFPLPAEAALMAAAFFAARTHAIELWTLIAAGIPAAIAGDVAGFWLGRKFGYPLITEYGPRVGLSRKRIKIAQWLFRQYGGPFVFTARFLPFLRNMAAALAGASRMGQQSFYFASGSAAACWVTGYGVAAYSLGEAFTELASSTAVSLGVVTTLVILGLPTLILRYEKRLLAKADGGFPGQPD
jgi:membrane protein DedA with SNARE-associated domain